MARVYLMSRPAGAVKLIYTIDQAVGAGCPNVRDDVALVQFLIRAALEDDKVYQIPAGAPLSIDGICGPQTVSYIKSWQQQELKIASDPLFRPTQDAQISPMTNRTYIGSRSHARYATVALNAIYVGTNGVEKHANIASDPRCPTALLPSIFWN